MFPTDVQNRDAADRALYLNRSFWTDVAPKYDDVSDRVFGAETRRNVLFRLRRKSGWGHVVEFGCGTGVNTRGLAEHAKSVVATDLSPGMLAVARTQVRSGRVTFREEDCQRPTFADHSFDTAVLGLVLHFVEPISTLREMRRILRPGGRIVIVNPGLESLPPLVRFCCRVRMIYYGITHYHRKPPKGFSRHLLAGHQLVELLRKLDFKSVEIEVVPSSARPFGMPIDYIEATT